MSLFHLLLVALIQGITEFLPVSSSGHLILLPNLTGSADQGQVIDVAAHVGTLGAVVLYFWPDVRKALSGIPRLIRGQTESPEARLVLCLAVATIPVIAAGLFLNLTGLSDLLRSTAVIGWMMLIFGAVLYWTDQKGAQDRVAEDWSLRHAFIMGLWQAVALIPGTSRSGITISAARLLGYGRHEAARLSMLMSIPTIAASAVLLGLEAASSADWAALRDGAIAAILSFASALVALYAMMRLLRSVSFTPYVAYRCVLGVVLLWVAYA
jgi:undecaprenyl-diphosphatase